MWSDIQNVFSPFEPVQPSLLDAWFVTRPDSPLRMLTLQLSPDRLPERRILVGQPASGKSSELTKLAAELQRQTDALVVRFDMTDSIDVERANPVEVVFLMGVAIFKVAASELPADRQPDRQLLERLKAGLETLVHTQTQNQEYRIEMDKLLAGFAVFGGAALAGPAGAAAGLAISPAFAKAVGAVAEKFMPVRFASGTNVQVVRKLEVEPQVTALIETLNAIIDDVVVKSNRSLVVLVDGLDKLRDADVISLNFLENKYLYGPRCSVLYVGPLDLYYSPRFGEVRARCQVVPFSHVKLRNRDQPEQLDERGYEVMRDVVRRRLRFLKYELGEVITVEVLDLLILGSGGVMRDFVRLVQSAALQAEIAGKKRIEMREAVSALNELRRQLQAQLTPDYHQILSKVRETHQRLGGSVTDQKDESEKCDLLLRNDIVLSYCNDDVWFDAHAALTEQPWKAQ
jgi:hypothetical protein